MIKEIQVTSGVRLGKPIGQLLCDQGNTGDIRSQIGENAKELLCVCDQGNTGDIRCYTGEKKLTQLLCDQGNTHVIRSQTEKNS